VGDGTTSSIVLAQEIVNLGIKNIATGYNTIDIKVGINNAVDAIVCQLLKDSQKI